MKFSTRRMVWLAVLVIVLIGAMAWLVQRLSFTSTFHYIDPVYVVSPSPDGRYLAYTEPNRTPVFVQDLQSGAVKEVPEVPNLQLALTWTGGGTYLVLRGLGSITVFDPDTGQSNWISDVSGYIPGTTGPWVGVVADDGSVQLQRLDAQADRFPLFSPGIVPLVITGDGPAIGIRKDADTQTLLYIDRPGVSPRVVTSGFRHVYASADAGAWLAVHPDESVYIGRPDGEARRLDLDAGMLVSGVSWAPDGRLVAVFISRKMEDVRELLVLSADGEIRFRTTAPFRGDWEYSDDEESWWSPDGRFFAFPVFVTPDLWFKKARVHRFDTTTWQEQRWRIHGDWSHQLADFAWSNERLVFARLGDRLIRFELRP
jgi:WD40 repeat protein